MSVLSFDSSFAFTYGLKNRRPLKSCGAFWSSRVLGERADVSLDLLIPSWRLTSAGEPAVMGFMGKNSGPRGVHGRQQPHGFEQRK